MKNWEAVKAAAIATWDWTKRTVMAFVDWAAPKVRAFMAGVELGWRIIKYAAGGVWDWTKQQVGGFVAWVKPKWDAAVDLIVKGWEKAQQWAGDAWDWAKQKAQDFWTWARPIVAAGIGYLRAAWDMAKRAAVVTWDFVVKAATFTWGEIKRIAGGIWDIVSNLWSSVSDSATVNWGEVKDAIVDSFIRGEFILDNFGDVVEHVWTGIQLGAVRAFGVVSHFFTSTLPVYLIWFRGAWPSILGTAFNNTGVQVYNLSNNIVRVFRNLPGLVAGTTNWSEVWVPLTRGAVSALQSLPNVPERVMSQMEQQLQREFTAQGTVLDANFAAFRERRLAEIGQFGFGLPPDEADAATAAAAAQAHNAGSEVGNAFAAGAKKGMEKWEASLRFSAEAMFRISEYADVLRGEGGSGHSHGGGAAHPGESTAGSLGVPSAASFGGGSAPSPVSSTVANDPQRARIIELLTAANGLLTSIRDKPVVNIESVSL